MKIALKYNAETGNIETDDGLFIAFQTGLERFEIKSGSKQDALIELKKAGFTVDEIIQLDQRGLI